MGNPLMLLVVDDDPDIAKLIKIRLLREAPHLSIETVDGGQACLDFMKKNKVDCILSDYQMPGMDGLELLQTLRHRGNDVPFIFVTGHGNEDAARNAFKNGANDYFTKDIGFAHFARIINSIEQAVSLRATREEHRKIDEAIRNTAEGVSSKTGEMFFRSLVQYLARALEVKYAFIGEIDDHDPGHARTVAFWAGEGFAETFEYQLINTPCDNVIKENLRCYPSSLKQLFPKDVYTEKFNVESYAGTPLWDSAGRVIGLLVVFDTKPMQDEDNVKALLKVFASRASAELERLKADKALKESESKFKILSEEAPVGIYLIQDMRYVYVNPELSNMLGYPEDELLQMGNVLDMVHPDDRESAGKGMDDVISGIKSNFACENRWLRKDGETIDVECNAALTIYNGRPAVIGTALDVTGRKAV